MSGTLKVTTLQDGASAIANLTLDTSGNTTAGGTVAMASSFKRNRIINGNMLIDQRNAGASITPTDGQYSVDRWQFSVGAASKFTAQQNAGSVTPPSGFTNYLGITSSSSYSIGAAEGFGVKQRVEGYNVADLGWGAAGASTITISFWVRSSLTGTFGGVLFNASATRFYVFSYTISAANTWEQKSFTVAGDTSGTWNKTSDVGIEVFFCFGAGSSRTTTPGSWGSTLYLGPTGQTSVVGTNGATFYVTGVQLEVGTVATPYERQIYSDQLAQCQRYYFKQTSATLRVYLDSTISNDRWFSFAFPVSMRSTPTLTATVSSGTFSDYGTSNTNFGAKIALASTTATADISAITASAEL